MELRLGKEKEARTTAEPFVKDANLTKSKFRTLGLYYHGTACFLLKDRPGRGEVAGAPRRSISRSARTRQYLVGRIHVSQSETPKPPRAFERGDHGVRRSRRPPRSKLSSNRTKFKNDPWEKTRLEALVKTPRRTTSPGAPSMPRASTTKSGKFGEAAGQVRSVHQRLRRVAAERGRQLPGVGFCQVQTKQFDPAVKALQPLTNHPRLADQRSSGWAKLAAGLAANTDPNNPNTRTQAYNVAINTLRVAADKANQFASQDPRSENYAAPRSCSNSPTRNSVRSFAKDAAGTYETIWNEKLLPAKAEETLQRLITRRTTSRATSPRSEDRIATFKQQFPNSTLMPLVLFRGAENAYAKAEDFAKQKKPEAKAAFADAGEEVRGSGGEVPGVRPRVNRAVRAGRSAFIAADDYEKATKACSTAFRPPTGMATSLRCRTCWRIATSAPAPAKAEDALQDNMLREKLTAAGRATRHVHCGEPEGQSKRRTRSSSSAICQKRLAIQLPPGNERNDALNKARAALERLPREFPQSPLAWYGPSRTREGDGAARRQERAVEHAPRARKRPASEVAGRRRLGMIYLANAAPRAEPAAQAAQGASRSSARSSRAGLGQKAGAVALLRYHHGVTLFESGKHPGMPAPVVRSGGTGRADAPHRGGRRH